MVDEGTQFGKFDDGGFFQGDLRLFQPQKSRIEINVLTSGKLRMKTGPQFKKRRNPAVYMKPPLAGCQGTGKDF